MPHGIFQRSACYSLHFGSPVKIYAAIRVIGGDGTPVFRVRQGRVSLLWYV